MISIPAGNTVRCTVTFAPESPGTVALADVTARAIDKQTGTVTNLTVATTGTNVFYADIAVPDTAGTGSWVVRFESNSPSAHISIEDATTTFRVNASAFPSP